MFVAIDLPESVKAFLTQLRDDGLKGIRWVRPENQHLTMRFLGDIDEEAEKRLRAELSSVSVSRFTLPIGGFGTFPGKGDPKVLWIGVGSAHPLLFQLRQRIDDAVLKAGIDCEMRDFVPHVTLGRCSSVSRASLRDLKKRVESADSPVFAVKTFSLFESRPSPIGSRYEIVDAWDLR
ncbi:RNA 2',3'-cyclic phosphodiesterase [Pelagicoccus sp. SDUM812003]|nr:RNA 2',3'-cyclic phosphodiesterase [Pelagicoccus sp. SDUM812003]